MFSFLSIYWRAFWFLTQKPKTAEQIIDRLRDAYGQAVGICISNPVSDEVKKDLLARAIKVQDEAEAITICASVLNLFYQESAVPVWRALKELSHDYTSLPYEDFLAVERERDRLYTTLYIVIKKKLDTALGFLLEEMDKEPSSKTSQQVYWSGTSTTEDN